jgi:hypothetical protein
VEFSTKSFKDTQIVFLSETPLEAIRFEERIAQVVPAAEASIHSFETYQDAYGFCSKARTAGVFFLFLGETTSLPINTVDELAAPFEALGSSAGLVVIAKNETAVASCYKQFGKSPRLLDILVESDLQSPAKLKESFLKSIHQFESLQSRTVAPKDELEFLSKAARKFEDVDLLNRITVLVTSRLDKDWHDNLLIESAPIIFSIPENQRWILQNSNGIQRFTGILEPVSKLTTAELTTSQSHSVVARAVTLAFRLYSAAKESKLEKEVESLTSKVTAFSPTLQKVLKAEKEAVIALLVNTSIRKTA